MSTSSQFSRCLWACGQYPVPGAPAGGTDSLLSLAQSSQKSVFLAIREEFSHPAAQFAVNQSNRQQMSGKSVVSDPSTQVAQWQEIAKHWQAMPYSARDSGPFSRLSGHEFSLFPETVRACLPQRQLPQLCRDRKRPISHFRETGDRLHPCVATLLSP